jgi:hypothetical protein
MITIIPLREEVREENIFLYYYVILWLATVDEVRTKIIGSDRDIFIPDLI